MSAYSHKEVDRFDILLDMWTNEACYLENKKLVRPDHSYKNVIITIIMITITILIIIVIIIIIIITMSTYVLLVMS